MRDVLTDLPKPLAPVRGRPFIAYLLEQLVRAGVSRFVISTGYKSELLEQALGVDFQGRPLQYSVEREPLGTGGALRLAWERFGGVEGLPWLVVNGDSYFAADLTEMRRVHDRSGCAATIAAVEVEHSTRFGTVKLSSSNRLLGFLEKSDAGRAWVNAGIYMLDAPFLSSLPEIVPLSLEKDVFPAWLDRGIQVFPRRGRFLDIGTPEAYARAGEFFAAP
ncbi:MAG: NTP transferase domain-containing protein [Acidobacteria bacterium]|nr:NTP transferase domain-containing protein [Acidobacteriota bacterium]